MSATTDTVTTVATCIGAGATLVLAGAAICALADWKNTLKNERADDCAGTAVDFDAAIGRYRFAKEAGSKWESELYDRMWEARTRLNIAVCRARRYYLNDLRNFPIQTIDEKLRDLKNSSLSVGDAKKIHAEIIDLLRPMHNLPAVPAG